MRCMMLSVSAIGYRKLTLDWLHATRLGHIDMEKERNINFPNATCRGVMLYGQGKPHLVRI